MHMGGAAVPDANPSEKHRRHLTYASCPTTRADHTWGQQGVSLLHGTSGYRARTVSMLVPHQVTGGRSAFAMCHRRRSFELCRRTELHRASSNLMLRPRTAKGHGIRYGLGAGCGGGCGGGRHELPGDEDSVSLIRFMVLSQLSAGFKEVTMGYICVRSGFPCEATVAAPMVELLNWTGDPW